MRKSHLVLLAGLLPLWACNDDDDDDGGGALQGQFIDSFVEGLEYDSIPTGAGAPLSGLTNAQGVFRYRPGESVGFQIGDLDLGSAPGADFLSPLQLAGATDINDDGVVNRARFLQTLDDDADPDNGIEIIQAVRDAAAGMSLDFDQTIANFETDAADEVSTLTALTSAGTRPLVPVVDAVQHLQESLYDALGGEYTGTFSGDDTGTWRAFVDDIGTMVGWGVSDTDGFFGFTGSVQPEGDVDVTTDDSMTDFTGTLTFDGELSGTWDNATAAETGSFAGTRVRDLDPQVDPQFLADAAGTYDGTFTLNGTMGNLTMAVGELGFASIEFDLPLSAEATGIVNSGPSSAQIFGLSNDGTVIQGTILTNGANPATASGTLVNGETGESGSWQATIDTGPPPATGNPNAGEWSGTFAGDGTGSWTGVVDLKGNFVGWTDPDSGSLLALVGTVQEDGTASITEGTNDATFDGTFDDVAGTVSGTWDATMSSDTGTWTGGRITDADLTPDDTNVAAIAGTYSGTYTLNGGGGTLTMDVDGDEFGDVCVTLDGTTDAAAFIQTIDATDADIVGALPDGTRMTGTILPAGTASGVLDNAVTGESGTWSATLDT